MENKKITIMEKINDWFENKYLSEGHLSSMFCEKHVDSLNKKLRPHNIWINMKTPQGESDTTWYAVEKLKPLIPATGWKKIAQFLRNPVEETLLDTSNTKKLYNYLNTHFSKELGFDPIKPAEPMRSEMPLPTYQTKNLPVVAKKPASKFFARSL